MATLRTILLVDDDAAFRRVAELALGRVGGFEVWVAGDTAQALERVRERTPDLVVLDFIMPGTDGAEALAVLRKNPTTATTPVIFLTGRADEAAALVGKDGVIGIVAKPCDPLRLATEVAALFERSIP